MASFPTVVIAAHVRDGREWAATNGVKIRALVVVTPRSPYAARGCVGDSVVWTRGALRLPQGVRDRLWDEVAPCFMT